jgi:hypothetical protein
MKQSEKRFDSTRTRWPNSTRWLPVARHKLSAGCAAIDGMWEWRLICGIRSADGTQRNEIDTKLNSLCILWPVRGVKVEDVWCAQKVFSISHGPSIYQKRNPHKRDEWLLLGMFECRSDGIFHRNLLLSALDCIQRVSASPSKSIWSAKSSNLAEDKQEPRSEVLGKYLDELRSVVFAGNLITWNGPGV